MLAELTANEPSKVSQQSRLSDWISMSSANRHVAECIGCTTWVGKMSPRQLREANSRTFQSLIAVRVEYGTLQGCPWVRMVNKPTRRSKSKAIQYQRANLTTILGMADRSLAELSVLHAAYPYELLTTQRQ